MTAARASLSSMQSLSSLSSMKLELEEDGKAGRVAGPWKEYVKNDGRKWYYNTETSKMTWTNAGQSQECTSTPSTRTPRLLYEWTKA